MVAHFKPTLTIFADASIYNDKRVAGWGGWARGDDRQPILLGGSAPWHKNSGVVEAHALSGMIHALRANGYFSDGDVSVLLQSDSLQALGVLNLALPNSWASARGTGSHIGRAANVAPAFIEPVRAIQAALAPCAVVYLRHVKGHKGGGTARSWANEQCDKRAKAEARAQIAGA